MTFLEWIFGKKQVVYTQEQIEELITDIKKFDAGAIDGYLTKHVDKTYAKWLVSHKGE